MEEKEHWEGFCESQHELSQNNYFTLFSQPLDYWQSNSADSELYVPFKPKSGIGVEREQ